ncbi:hypothetical protein PsYK624_058280 [Phanerochaete sordida]|uniref:BTB domain-containing protein n=1 Tax=Phanerochaete sordida TaxID=48140 RepID=A0A9P3G5R2_9APHY|nr:hypothetical protein PsYK624_058280 [Phanerochaete sordida]
MRDQLDPQHDILWFDDGNVVVAARGMSFKLHKSVLALHSTVFLELFDSLDTSESHLHGGCPVLCVNDYGPDLARLLLVVYGSDRRYFARDKPLSFSELRSVALLAQKYQIEEIISEACACLKIAFTAQMNDEAYWERPAEYIRSGPTNPLWCEDRDLVGVVSLARAVRCPSVEVMALYHCCRIGAGVLFSGVQYDDMEVELSREDLRTCVNATDLLYQHNTYVMNALTDMFAYPSETPRIIPCRTSADCKNALGLLIASGLQNEQFSSPRALECLDRWIDEQSEMCYGCREALKNVVNERRKEVFDQLGAMFGVEPWPPVDS